jgi:uncharacterized repeat protein (TIGR04138 family)
MSEGKLNDTPLSPQEMDETLFNIAMRRGATYLSGRPYSRQAYKYIYMVFPRIRRLDAEDKFPHDPEKFMREFQHVDGRGFCQALRKVMLDDFGIMICDILAHWHIKNTHDIGVIVMDLVAIKLFAADPEDDIHDFDEVYPIDSSLWCKPDLSHAEPLSPCPLLP